MKIGKALSIGARPSLIELPLKKCYEIALFCYEIALSIVFTFLSILQLICCFVILFQAIQYEPIMTSVTDIIQGKETKDKVNPSALITMAGWGIFVQKIFAFLKVLTKSKIAEIVLERSIFQTFWKPHCCTKSFFLS